MRHITEYRFLGARMHAMTVTDWLEAVRTAVETRSRVMMVGQNVHSVYLLHRDPEFRELQERADYVRVDGLPLIVMGRILGLKLQREHRSGFMDLAWPLFDMAEAGGWKVFYLGTTERSLAAGLERIRASYPRLLIDGADGHFDAARGSAENRERLERIREFAPDLLILGMGMPRQERWLLANSGDLNVPAIVASGAAMDYISGATAAAPRWLSGLGLEWVFRLASEPRRLWHRYLLEPWFVLWLFLGELAKRLRGRAQTCP